MPRPTDMFALLVGLPDWLAQILVCATLGYVACVFGVAFGKMGRSPYWGLAYIVPFVGMILLWSFGLGRWPQSMGNEDIESGL